MSLSIDVKVLKGIPTKNIQSYMDTAVFSVARTTLDFTNAGMHFPYLTGALNMASMSEGVVQNAPCEYSLGAAGVDYAPIVYEFGNGTNWTNPSTYPQWYVTEFNQDRNVIMQNAIKTVLGRLK